MTFGVTLATGVTATGAPGGGGTTGTGVAVLQNSPTLITPNIGVAAATSVTTTGQVVEAVAGRNTGTVVAIPTTGQTVTILATTNCQICDPAGLLAALTIQFPVPTGDGHTFELSISQSVTTLTLTPNAGATIKGSFTTVSSYLATKYRYVASNTTWYEIV